jgi:hypothetical protein
MTKNAKLAQLLQTFCKTSSAQKRANALHAFLPGLAAGGLGGALAAGENNRLEGAVRGALGGAAVSPLGNALASGLAGAAGGYTARKAPKKEEKEPEKKEPEEKKEAGFKVLAKKAATADFSGDVGRELARLTEANPSGGSAKVKKKDRPNVEAFFKKTEAKKTEEKKEAGFELFARKAAEATSDAAAIGLLAGYEDGIIPSQAAFEKIAAKTGYSANGLKHAYLKKIAAMGKWPWLLGGLAAATVGAPMLSGAYNRVMYPSYYSDAPGYGMMDAPNVGAYGGFSPRAESELWKTIAREGLKQRQASSLLQGISGAYRPAGNPWGNSHPMMMPQ